jgi:hypothetical protein
MGKKKASIVFLAVFTFAYVRGFQGQPHRGLKPGMRNAITMFANEKEDLLPETSFGAEIVPESQRPINEYLDMTRAPLFGWASNDVGMNGVSTSFAGGNQLRFIQFFSLLFQWNQFSSLAHSF